MTTFESTNKNHQIFIDRTSDSTGQVSLILLEGETRRAQNVIGEFVLSDDELVKLGKEIVLAARLRGLNVN